jgi:hypothetical protein
MILISDTTGKSLPGPSWRLEAVLLREQGRDENAAVSTWKSQGGAVLGKEGAVWNCQPVLFERHRGSPSAFAWSAPQG